MISNFYIFETPQPTPNKHTVHCHFIRQMERQNTRYRLKLCVREGGRKSLTTIESFLGSKWTTRCIHYSHRRHPQWKRRHHSTRLERRTAEESHLSHMSKPCSSQEARSSPFREKSSIATPLGFSRWPTALPA